MRTHDERLPRHLRPRNPVGAELRRRYGAFPYAENEIASAKGKFISLDARMTRGGWAAVLPHSAFVLAVVLQDHADKEGAAWPGTERIERLTGMGRSTITRARAALVESSFWRIEKRGSKGRHRYHYLRGDPKPLDQVVLDDTAKLQEFRREFRARLSRTTQRLKHLDSSGFGPLSTVQNLNRNETTAGNRGGGCSTGFLSTRGEA